METEQAVVEALARGRSDNGEGLCLLSLGWYGFAQSALSLTMICTDGGGVRGLSSLRILKGLMMMVNERRAAAGLAAVRPQEIFDLIGGTSTGG